MNISVPDPDASTGPDGTHSVAEPRAGPVAEVGMSEASEPRLATVARLLGDAVAVLVLVWALWWLSDDDGGLQSMATAELGYAILAATPVALMEARRQSTAARLILLALAAGWLVALAFGVDRSGFVDAALVAGSAPMIFLVAAALHRRPWGPALLVAIVGLSFSAWAWDSLLKWWGFVQLGAQPRWDLVSWRNQSGILSGAFGLFLLGPTLVGRRTLPLVTGGIAALALTGAWLSSSRGAAIFTALGAVAMVAVASLWRSRVPGQPWWGPSARAGAVALAAFAMAAGLLSMLPPGTASPVSSRSEAVSGNAIQRTEHWRTAVRMGMSRPLVGLGPGSYHSSMTLFNSPDGRLTAAAHNEWLEAWSDGGLALAVPMWSVAAAGAVLVLRRGRRPPLHEPLSSEAKWSDSFQLGPSVQLGSVGVVAAVGGHAAIDFDFHYPVIAVLFAVALGALASSKAPPPSAAGVGPSKQSGPRRDGWGDGATIVAIVAVGATAFILGLGIWGATAERDARSDAFESAPLDAVGRGQAPWDTSARLFVARVQQRSGDLRGAIATIAPAMRWNPLDPRPALETARLRYELGEISDVELVRQLDGPPTRLGEWSRTAELLLRGGSLDLADEVATVATRFHPTYERWGIGRTVAQAWHVRVGVAVKRGDCDAVRTLLGEATASDFDVDDRGYVAALREAAARHCDLRVEMAPSSRSGADVP